MSACTASPPAGNSNTSRVRPLLETIGDLISRGLVADLAQRPDWTDDLLEGTRIVNVNERAAHLVGAYAGRAGMIGQSVGAFWPRVGRGVLAELIAVVATGRSCGATCMRKLASDGILRDPVVTAWRSRRRGAEIRCSWPSMVRLTMTAPSGISAPATSAIAKLIHHLPTALLQVDASRMGQVFGELKAGGVNDLDVYLDGSPGTDRLCQWRRSRDRRQPESGGTLQRNDARRLRQACRLPVRGISRNGPKGHGRALRRKT